jgi:predicted PurR-regulated permease PerM/GNAT superfamily N-acetyltransferase
METSPRWSTTTKLIVMLAVLAGIGYFLYRFQVLIMPLLLAVILAYTLNPLVAFLSERLRLSRTPAVLILYAFLILAFVGLLGGAGLLLQQQISGLLTGAMNIINGLPAWINSLGTQPVVLGPFTLDFSSVNAALLQDALLPAARDWIGSITQWATGAASDIAAFIGWAAFAFLVAFYLLHDIDALQRGLVGLVPQEYKRDAGRLFEELGPIWNAFLRGQLLLSLIMGVAVGVTTALLGVRYALVLGILAALAEFVPIIGANVVGVTAFFIAFFQPANWFGLSPIVYAVVVVAVAGLLQQLEGNFLIPRIMGGQLKLHPVIMIVGALVGFTLLGLPGLLLSGPIIATARVFGKYVHAKLLNLPPWPEKDEPNRPGAASVRVRPARNSDRNDMLELTAQIWEGHDYTPQVWSAWLADRAGLLAAAEADKRMVGFGKLTRLSPQEWWLEGLRVHPGYQGLKIGSRLTEYLVAEWKKRGGGVLRLATSSERVEVHHLCARLGFQRTGVYRLISAAPLARGAHEFQPLTPADAAEAAALWRQRAAAWKTPDLVNDSWKWGRFSETLLLKFIQRGDAWWWRGRTAILLGYRRERDKQINFEAAAVLAPPKTLALLLRQMRGLAHERQADRTVWVMPDSPHLTQSARNAGYKPVWDERLWLFERDDITSGTRS